LQQLLLELEALDGSPLVREGVLEVGDIEVAAQAQERGNASAQDPTASLTPQ
jgi:hypothetical protein